MSALNNIPALLYIFVMALSPLTSQADWVSEWQQVLGDVWSQTKMKAQEVTSVVQERFNPKAPVAIGIAYGTEKKKWLEWAVTEFAKTESGKKIKINLIPMGSVEGAEAVLRQDKRIHVWSPASGLVHDLLAEPWQKEHGTDPILSDAPLALTPMVIVMWEDRYEAFLAKYHEVNFNTISQALNEQTGWAAIANKPEWGLFTFGHTAPNQSNSGLLTLVLMAYDYANVFRGLKPEQIMDEGFITWLKETQSNIGNTEHSTGTLMNTLLQRGPSEYSGVVVYENLALANLDKAKGRWGRGIKVIYPTRSIWNDNPYYILNVPWSSQEQRDAAKLFEQFLLSEPAQRVARDEYLFRPASVDLPILDAHSAFRRLQDIVQIDVPTIQRPTAEVLKQLLQIWQRVAR